MFKEIEILKSTKKALSTSKKIENSDKKGEEVNPYSNE